ncbi:PREDICTED: protein SYM1-like [Amphimedon queenslandica]|uniref:Mpv17-like protein n=1 Tax=Amphimedon queenslandica TaxID=400682 RepID=A0A1X7VKD0_AMPQE|nr:PREDICTED: protein SYM1-like [Amphimedon queenslandica]|eukprot:XP_003384042.1 PREDICTED: protein SYM1-like [Amphimedon queenslandica]
MASFFQGGGRVVAVFLRRGAQTPLRTQSRRFSPMAWYNSQLEKAPVITKSITSGILFGLGDVIGQFILPEENGKLNFARVGRAAVFGSLILGPLAHLHFNFLEYMVVKRLALTGTRMAFLKMFFDQFTYWAISINTIYLFTLPKLEGKTNDQAMDNVRARIWPTMKANWCLWPIAQLINFKLIPVAHQLNFVLIVSLGWASYLSFAGGKMQKE